MFFPQMYYMVTKMTLSYIFEFFRLGMCSFSWNGLQKIFCCKNFLRAMLGSSSTVKLHSQVYAYFKNPHGIAYIFSVKIVFQTTNFNRITRVIYFPHYSRGTSSVWRIRNSQLAWNGNLHFCVLPECSSHHHSVEGQQLAPPQSCGLMISSLAGLVSFASFISCVGWWWPVGHSSC